jgi:hypothetical protein
MLEALLALERDRLLMRPKRGIRDDRLVITGPNSRESAPEQPRRGTADKQGWSRGEQEVRHERCNNDADRHRTSRLSIDGTVHDTGGFPMKSP